MLWMWKVGVVVVCYGVKKVGSVGGKKQRQKWKR